METFAGEISKEQAIQLLRSGQIDQARSALESLAKAQPDDPQIHSCLGIAYNQSGNSDGAISAFETSLQLQKTPKSHYNLGLAYKTAGRTDDAVAQFRAAIALDTNYTPAQEALKKHETAAVPPSPEPTVLGQPPMPAPEPQPQPTTVIDVVPDFNTVFATPTAPPDLNAEKAQKEFEWQERRKGMIKSGLIYGILCGAGFLLLIRLACVLFFAAPMAMMLGGGKGLLISMLSALFEGGFIGGLVGLWVGLTCGGDSEGFKAGAAIGAVFGLITGLVTVSQLGAGMLGGIVIAYMLCYAFVIGIFGFFIGKMVEASIGW
ncbi:MAG: tetratricopeptide repeat protein [Armatimonadota bacterium]|nr:tetratricopeptide repeat protein [bacterium]